MDEVWDVTLARLKQLLRRKECNYEKLLNRKARRKRSDMCVTGRNEKVQEDIIK